MFADFYCLCYYFINVSISGRQKAESLQHSFALERQELQGALADMTTQVERLQTVHKQVLSCCVLVCCVFVWCSVLFCCISDVYLRIILVVLLMFICGFLL